MGKGYFSFKKAKKKFAEAREQMRVAKAEAVEKAALAKKEAEEAQAAANEASAKSPSRRPSMAGGFKMSGISTPSNAGQSTRTKTTYVDVDGSTRTSRPSAAAAGAPARRVRM